MSFRGDVHLRIALMFGVALECGNWEMVASMGTQRRGWRRVRRAAGRGVAALGRADDSWSLHFFHTQITNVNRTRCSRSGTHSYTCTWLGIVILLERRVLLQELSGRYKQVFRGGNDFILDRWRELVNVPTQERLCSSTVRYRTATSES